MFVFLYKSSRNEKKCNINTSIYHISIYIIVCKYNHSTEKLYICQIYETFHKSNFIIYKKKNNTEIYFLK